jgi:hypothetical protein
VAHYTPSAPNPTPVGVGGPPPPRGGGGGGGGPPC